MMFSPTALLEILLLVAASEASAPAPVVGFEEELRAILLASPRSKGRLCADAFDLHECEVRRIVNDSITCDAAATFEDLRWLSRDLDELRGPVLRALGASGDARALEWMVAQLDEPSLVDDALQELARFGRVIPDSLAEVAHARAVEHLTSASPNRRRLARSLAVALDCEEAIPVLVEQLYDADEVEHRQLEAALETLSGVRPGPDELAWQRWLTAELEWSAANAAPTVAALRSPDPAEVVRALRALSARAYQRARWSLAIAELLEPERPVAIRQQACLALARLRSVAARGALEAAATFDPSADVQRLAASALLALGVARGAR
jgi:hypothetical protein